MTPSSVATPAVDLSPEARAERLGAIDLPTKRDEAWRYAPHATLAKLSFGPAEGTDSVPVPADVMAQIPAIDGPRVVVVNGRVSQDHSDLSAVPSGLSVTTLGEFVGGQSGQSGQEDRLVAEHFATGQQPPADAFVAINAAYGNDGAVIRVADGHRLDTPIHVVAIELPGQSQNASCTGVVIAVGADAAATVVETRIGGGQEFGGANIRTTVALEANAELDHVILQDAPSAQVQLSHIEVTQAAASEYRARSFNLGAGYGRFGYRVELAGEGARADLSGLYFGLGDQTLDQQLTVIHGAKDCTSRQSFRGVLDDASTGVFSGGIDVRPGADGTDAEQSNDNLLLSDRAEVNTQPRLEILADDVACVHGATVGQLDDGALYYMRSRGIPGPEAQRLLIAGFADQQVDEVNIESVRAWITERLGHTEEYSAALTETEEV